MLYTNEKLEWVWRCNLCPLLLAIHFDSYAAVSSLQTLPSRQAWGKGGSLRIRHLWGPPGGCSILCPPHRGSESGRRPLHQLPCHLWWIHACGSRCNHMHKTCNIVGVCIKRMQGCVLTPTGTVMCPTWVWVPRGCRGVRPTYPPPDPPAQRVCVLPQSECPEGVEECAPPTHPPTIHPPAQRGCVLPESERPEGAEECGAECTEQESSHDGQHNHQNIVLGQHTRSCRTHPQPSASIEDSKRWLIKLLELWHNKIQWNFSITSTIGEWHLAFIKGWP